MYRRLGSNTFLQEVGSISFSVFYILILDMILYPEDEAT
jgi:hypothetical protein